MKKDVSPLRKKAFPSVSIIIPVHKKYPHFKQDEEKMKSLLKETETILLKDFPSKKAKTLIADMRKLAREIDYKHLSDGLGLYISPYREKIFHFSFPVKEKVIIDKTFEVRDLLLEAKNNISYAVLTISEKKVRVLYGTNHTLTEGKIDEMPYNINDVGGKGSSRESSFTSFSSSKNVSDNKENTEKKTEKFLKEIDRVISSDKILKNSDLIICAPVRIIGHFKNITKNNSRILNYLPGNFDKLNHKKIQTKISGILEQKQIEVQKNALIKLEDAVGKKKSASGLHDVWKSAHTKKGRLLLVEKDFSSPARTGRKKSSLITDNLDKQDINYISDAVDDVIELVIKYGGDVVFMENGSLDEHGRIALINYY